MGDPVFMSGAASEPPQDRLVLLTSEEEGRFPSCDVSGMTTRRHVDLVQTLSARRTQTVEEANRMRKERLRRISRVGDSASESFCYYRIHPIKPVDAFPLMLEYLTLDPDGGILNLSNSNQGALSAQVSKIPVIRRGPLKLLLAAYALVRLTLNPLYIVWHSALIVLEYIFDQKTSFVPSVEDVVLRMKGLNLLGVPVAEMLLALATIEICILLPICARMLKLFCVFLASSRSGEESVVTTKYMCLAKLFWKEIHSLQNASALRGFAFVHPNLIAKNTKFFFTARQAAARVILEALLERLEETATDEELQDTGIALIIQSENAGSTVEERQHLVQRYMHRSLFDNVWHLVFSPQVRKHLDGRGAPGMNPSALRLAGRLQAIVAAEWLAFISVCALMFAMGFLGFFAKICICAVMLDRIHLSTGMVLAYMILFMNQAVGALGVNHLLFRRVQDFVFGGVDAMLTKEEESMIRVYLTKLMQVLWESKYLSFYQKLAITLTFDDDDFQRLIIEEDHQVKSAIILGTQKYIDQTKPPKLFTERTLVSLVMLGRTTSSWTGLSL